MGRLASFPARVRESVSEGVIIPKGVTPNVPHLTVFRICTVCIFFLSRTFPLRAIDVPVPARGFRAV